MWDILFMIGTCGGLEENTLSPAMFIILVVIELSILVALLHPKKE
jgi:hypothetical protein